MMKPQYPRHNIIVLAVADILVNGLGLDLNDPNFMATPDRVARAYSELCAGLYNEDEIEEILSKTFPSTYDEMVVVTDIDAVGLCPHHLMPVRYKIHVGYIPAEDGRVIGLSKIPRLVCLLAARPVLQEQLTVDIADKFESALLPLGVMVVVDGGHSCMQCRGIKQINSKMITSAIKGVFREDERPRKEFLMLVGNF